MSGVLFTSDLHLKHPRVAELRGFDTTEAHDEAIAENWCSKVKSGDQVWVQGDITSGAKAALQPALDLLNSLPGEKHLVTGNHDACHPMHRDAFKWQRVYMDAFVSIQPFARRKVEGEQVLLSHFPYERDRGEPRYMQYRLRHEGLPLLHGHTHGTEKATLTEYHDPVSGELLKRIREVHVGVDAWGLAPVTLDEVAEALLWM